MYLDFFGLCLSYYYLYKTITKRFLLQNEKKKKPAKIDTCEYVCEPETANIVTSEK